MNMTGMRTVGVVEMWTFICYIILFDSNSILSEA